MISVEDWAEIRRLHKVKGLSKRAIARRLGIHRDTVTRALESDEPLTYQRAARGSILDPYKPKIHALLAENPDLTSVRIFEIIQEVEESPIGIDLESLRSWGGHLNFLFLVRPSQFSGQVQKKRFGGQAAQPLKIKIHGNPIGENRSPFKTIKERRFPGAARTVKEQDIILVSSFQIVAHEFQHIFPPEKHLACFDRRTGDEGIF